MSEKVSRGITATENGIVTRTTKSRLEELASEEELLMQSIKAEEDKVPKITKEFILFTLQKFRDLDLRFEKNMERSSIVRFIGNTRTSAEHTSSVSPCWNEWC